MLNKKKPIIIIVIIIIIISVTLSACNLNPITRTSSNGEYKIYNINIYKDTPVWDLAWAVYRQNTKKIEKIINDNQDLLNYQDPKYGATLLLWAIGVEKYKSAEALLKCGADTEIASTSDGQTPLLLASGFSWIDNDAKKDAKYVKLLLRYGANPNRNYIKDPERSARADFEYSPLMCTIGAGIEKTKALVEAGADINYKTSRGYTVAIDALLSGVSATPEGMEYAYYLIVEKKAKVSDPYFRTESHDNDDPKYPVNILRRWVYYNEDSELHKIKMEIVKEFARQGVNYWNTEIDKSTLESIKKRYPDSWKEYIKKY